MQDQRKVGRDNRPLREPLPTREVEDAVAAFVQYDGIQLGITPAMARWKCHAVSAAFYWYCVGRDIYCRVVKMSGMKVEPNVPGASTSAHYAVWFPDDDKIVDFTARQFWIEVPCPLIVNRHQLETLWAKIEWPRKKRMADHAKDMG